MTRRQRIGDDAPDSSATIQGRVAVAYQRQLARQGCANAFLTTTQTNEVCELDAEMRNLLGAAMERFHWSARSHYRVLKLSRTIADLAGEVAVNTQHIAEAIQYRRAL
jgi:magnesium chelatase family protein